MNNMFDIFIIEINKQIHKGFFPVDQLNPANNPFDISIYDKIEQISSRITKDCNDYSKMFSSLFSQWLLQQQLWNNVVIPNSIDDNNRYWSLVNCIINANCIPDDLWDNKELFEAATNLCPAVTQLDCVLWEGASTFFFVAYCIKYDKKMLNAWIRSTDQTIANSIDDESFFEVITEFAFLLSNLLQKIQEKELISGKTIRVEAGSSSILELLLNPWEECDRSVFIDLTGKESEKLNRLINERKRLSALSIETKKHAKAIAESTAVSWEAFVELINDISSKERYVVLSQMNQSLSSSQKLEIIKKYDAFVSEICEEKLAYNGKSYSRSRVFSQIDQRFSQAHNYCYVSSGNIPAFKLTSAIRILVKNPTASFNYIFITYHKLRLEPTLENARSFFSIVNRCMKMNLGVELIDRPYASVDEMAEDFCNTVKAFYTQNKQGIDFLLFDDVQADIIDIVGHSAIEYCIENEEETWINNIKSMQIKYLSKTLDKLDPNLLAEEITHAFAENEKNKEQSVKIAYARQLITSLSIIYMVYATMNRLINRAPDIFANVDAVKILHRKLCELDDNLIHKVYQNAYDINEFREKMGMDTRILVEQESEANARLCEVILSEVESISQNFNDQGIQELFESKTSIIESIRRFSIRNLPDRIVERIDSISSKLCNVFVNCCKNNADQFDKTKSELVRFLGEYSWRLPKTALDTLTTAEMLFNIYAADNTDYAEKGFDYSSISALYYQAFEVAYNEMIWRPYANWINQQLDETADDPKIIRKLYREYLPGSEGNINKYYFPQIGYKKEDPRRVATYCVFGTFYHLLMEVYEKNTAPTFREWFSRLAGYDRVTDMLVDKEFMNVLGGFKDAVYKAKTNRNNASHGGNIINREQCCQDKKTVLSELETARSNSLGLIQQLLLIIKRQPS